MGTDALKAYAEDPDVKFILTERDPDKWVKSVNSTVAEVVKIASSFPINILKHFEAESGQFFHLNCVMYDALSDGTRLPDPRNPSALRRNYVEYIDMAKKTIPEDRLLHLRLEDGLGWEQICPFLGVPIPQEPYPGRNEPEKFQGLVKNYLGPKIQTAAIRLGAIVVPVIGVGIWAGMKFLRR